MADTTTDLRLVRLVSELRTLLEEHGYRMPAGDDRIRELVLARLGLALKDLVQIFEGRTR